MEFSIGNQIVISLEIHIFTDFSQMRTDRMYLVSAYWIMIGSAF